MNEDQRLRAALARAHLQQQNHINNRLDYDDMDDEEDASDSEDSEADVPLVLPLARQAQQGERLQLERLLRLFGQPRRVEDIATNDQLVDKLRESKMLTSERVIKAMRVCSRNRFLPFAQANPPECFQDTPIRLEGFDFNVSAPHMHATCMEALKLEPGHSVLDVGSGCGVVTACCAFLVGKAGLVVGMDVKRSAVSLARSSVRGLKATCSDFATTAAPITFMQHNVFIPHRKHLGRYDRIHVGATCPPARIPALVALLKPSGGMIVSPVQPSDLQLITLLPSGDIVQKMLTQVRYSDLELPSDAELIKASFDAEREAANRVTVPRSTFGRDFGLISGGCLGTSNDSKASDQSGFSGFAMRSERSPSRSWSDRIAQIIPCASGGESPDRMSTDSDCPRATSPRPVSLSQRELGPPDCSLVGCDWVIPAHKSVLQVRCDQVRAMSESGMRDADQDRFQVPEHFSQAAVNAFMTYLYTDCLPDGTSPEEAVAIVMVAQFYGVTRLAHMCEALLAKQLANGDASEEDVCDAALCLLEVADEAGLTQLSKVALDFIIDHHEQVLQRPKFLQMSVRHVAVIAQEAARYFTRMCSLVAEAGAQAPAAVTQPPPSRLSSALNVLAVARAG